MKPLLLTLTLATIFFAQTTYAQETKLPVSADGTLEAGKGFVSCSGSNCSACDFVVLGNTAIKWLIIISFLFFAVLAFRAGIKLVTSQGNSSALTDAKSSFTNAFIGLVIILLAFLLVDTIMRQLVKGSGTIEGYGPWNEVRCSKQVEPKKAQEGYFDGDAEFVAFVEAGGEESGVIGGGSNCPAALPSQVVLIPGTSFSARPEIVQKFIAMRDAAQAKGITLTVRSGWRSEERQVALFNQLCPSGTCGRVKAARPCSMGGDGSNHNSGNAIDIAVGCGNGSSGCNTPTYIWLKTNGGRYGFNNNLPTDPPHWSPSGR